MSTPLTEAQVQSALKEVIDPNTGKDLMSSRSARNIKVSGADVSVYVELGYPAKTQIETIRQAVIDKIKSLPGAGNVSVNVYQKIVSHSVQRDADGDTDTRDALIVLSSVVGLPTTFVLDRTVSVAVKVLGEIDRDGLRRVLSGLL